jgi:hypothetical protein
MEYRMARQVCFVAAMLGVPSLSMAQELASAAAIANPASIQARKLTADQLADLVAPIALYPDALLSQVLVASTYPLEVVQAQQWLRRNESLRGEALMDAARQQPWDASVQGLVAFPDALATLNEDIQWTTALGNAFLAQESDVMLAVQRMRARARSAGKLSSTRQQTVSDVVQEGQTAIEIVPADPQVIYVPQYDPVYVWGSPAWDAYPPLSYAHGFGFGLGIDVGFWFGGWSWGWGWGWGPNWYGGSVYVDNAFFRHCGWDYGHHGGSYGGHYGGNHGGYPPGGHSGREPWQHDGGHRMGVAYPNGRLAGRYDAASRASRSAMAGPGSWNRPGGVTRSPSGNRTEASGARSGRTDQAWRSGTGTGTWSSRGGGADLRRSSSGDPWRGSAGVTRSQRPSAGYSAASPRYSASSPRSSASSLRRSAPSPGYSAPSRPFSSSAPSRGFQPAPRSSSSGGPGRSFGGGISQRSGGGGGSRGTAGGSGPGGGSRGGGRRH